MLTATKIKRETVLAVPLKRPANAKAHWVGVSHEKMVTMVEETIRLRKLEIKKQRFYLSRKGADLTCSMKLSNGFWFSFDCGNSMRKQLRFYATGQAERKRPFVFDSFLGHKMVKHADHQYEISWAVDEWLKRIRGFDESCRNITNHTVTREKIEAILPELERNRYTAKRIREQMLNPKIYHHSSYYMIFQMNKLIRKHTSEQLQLLAAWNVWRLHRDNILSVK